MDMKADLDVSKEDLQGDLTYEILVNKVTMRRLVKSVTEFG